MFKCQNLLKPRKLPESSPIIEIPRMKTVVKSYLHDGLVDSFVTIEKFEKFGDEHQHWRDYGLQTLIQAEATELLKPCPVISLSPLSAADTAKSASINVARLHDHLSALNVQDVKKEPVTDVKEPVTEPK